MRNYYYLGSAMTSVTSHSVHVSLSTVSASVFSGSILTLSLGVLSLGVLLLVAELSFLNFLLTDAPKGTQG